MMFIHFVASFKHVCIYNKRKITVKSKYKEFLRIRDLNTEWRELKTTY